MVMIPFTAREPSGFFATWLAAAKIEGTIPV